MPSEKIIFNGEPVYLRIDSLNAKEVPSKFGSGKEYVYTCNGGQNHIYLPDDAVESIRNSRARAGDQVTIQRKKEGQYVRWIVRVVSDAAEPPAAPAAAPASRRATNGAQQIAPPLPASVYVSADEWLNDPGYAMVDEAQRGKGSVPAAAPERATGFVALSKCYREAVEIAMDAVRYASEQGLPLPSPVFEDIRCMAATLLIEKGKR